ncbi:MAG: SRPBCC domain-containing protein [Carboxylicivirga sp.]|jgi:hypothetical protein|nr:SRPBCC domain-containing protein [Carboxylicivirga sp.]
MEIMTIFKSKWFLFVGIPILILLILASTGRKSVHAEIIIKAKPSQVWKVLMDKAAYADWNTVLVPTEGDLIEGTTVKYMFYQDENNKSVIPSKVKKITENKLLNQGGGMTGILTYNHKYMLEEVSEGTKLIIHEDYRGVGVHFWNPSPVEKAYERLCLQIKKRVESINW